MALDGRSDGVPGSALDLERVGQRARLWSCGLAGGAAEGLGGELL